MKAWKVTSKWVEASVVVLATTRSGAKQAGRCSDWLCDEDWTDLKATRMPDADHLIEHYEPGEIPWDARLQRLCRFLGWHEIEEGESCEECGLNSMSGVPESQLNEDGICVECQIELVAAELTEHSHESSYS